MYSELPYANKFDNIDEADGCLLNHNLPKPICEEIKNMNSSYILVKEIEHVM